MLKETASCVWSWTTKDQMRFRAFAVAAQGEVVLVDPVALSSEEEKALRALGEVGAILLTCPWHERESAALSRRFGAPVYAHPQALSECESRDIQPFAETLPLGIEALPATGSSPGQVAFLVPFGGGSLIVGDFWMNLDFAAAPWLMRLIMKHVIKLRDGLHLFPPAKAQDPQAMVETSRRLLERPFENLLVSHGQLLIGDAKARMLERLKQGP